LRSRVKPVVQYIPGVYDDGEDIYMVQLQQL